MTESAPLQIVFSTETAQKTFIYQIDIGGIGGMREYLRYVADRLECKDQ
jgi:hypothetical protein